MVEWAAASGGTRYGGLRPLDADQGLLAGGTYWWLVVMIDKDGRRGSPEGARSFRVGPGLARENPIFLARVSNK